MIRYNDVGGIIMKNDTPLVEFKYRQSRLIKVKLLTDVNNLPIEYKGVLNKYRATDLFLRDRITPPTRQFINEDLKKVGIAYYDPDAMLKLNKGRNMEDQYWVDMK
jgi:hypothetical protein